MEEADCGGGVVRAYAPPSNVSLRGSRFVGSVEVRARGGRVWLRGRQVPAWWLVAQVPLPIFVLGGGVRLVMRYLVAIGGLLLPLIAVGSLVTAWLVKRQRRGKGTSIAGVPMSLRVTSVKVVSWRATNSTQPTKHVLRPSIEGGTGGRCIDGTSEVRTEIPLGQMPLRADLCLEIANSQCDRLMAVLRGHEIAQ